jgi:hypothetical protein
MGKFYVFSVNTDGHFFFFFEAVYRSYGNLFGSGNLKTEAANLKAKYSDSATMELVVVDSHSWHPVTTVNSLGSGMSNVDFPISQNIKAIVQYLLEQGISKKEAKAAVRIMEKQKLQVQDQVARDIIFGVPIESD